MVTAGSLIDNWRGLVISGRCRVQRGLMVMAGSLIDNWHGLCDNVLLQGP